MWERVLAFGASLSGAIVYVAVGDILITNQNRENQAQLNTLTLIWLFLVLGLWILTAVLTRFFDEDHLEGPVAALFYPFYIPGLLAFFCGGIVLLAPIWVPVWILLTIIKAFE